MTQANPEPTAYDAARHGARFDWDRHAFRIGGRAQFLLSGEFHYWRLPDRSRWAEVLRSYRAAGLNCVRIYFHWGVHSPAPGVYRFDGHRDVEYLLRLCEEIGLHVLAAPGPYICAETSGGGFPAWLAAERGVAIRHLSGLARKRFDERFMQASREWYAQIIPILARHEITRRDDGCVLAIQLENENIESKFGLLRDYPEHMRGLAEAARELGATVPFFHNDPLPFGSWNSGRPGRFGVDLYGFDRYVIWAPKGLPGPTWDERAFARAVDSTEKTIRGFGGGAASTPIFLPEVQGGWFNHWGTPYGFDEIYDFYGEPFTRTVLDSFAAQGATALSFYMFYGGTNRGALGDPDVYTSYDYSACIREHGYLSGRLRRLRAGLWFLRTFGESVARTDAVKGSGASASVPGVLLRHRRSVVDGTDFHFLRNFDRARRDTFTLSDGRTALPCRLPWRESFVAVGHCPTSAGLLRLCTLPVLARGPYADGELWAVEHGGGALAFEGSVRADGARATERDGGTIVEFEAPGLAKLSGGGRPLYVACLSRAQASTLAVRADGELALAWGAYELSFERDGKLRAQTIGREDVTLVHAAGGIEGSRPVEAPVPGVHAFSAGGEPVPPVVRLERWQRRTVDWNALDWKPIDFATQRDPLDHGFTSGHVAYRARFQAKAGTATLRLNVRHRCAVWLNGKGLGGHVTYARRLLAPGAKTGPDPVRFGARTYELRTIEGENALIVLVESFGQNRQVVVFDDIRNPRGILSARLRGTGEPNWEIRGVDVRTLDDPFDTLGLPGERADDGWMDCEPPENASPDAGVIWYRASFDWHEHRHAPLRLQTTGPHNAALWLNGTLVGRYVGTLGPQHDFFLPDGLVREGTNEVRIGMYATQAGAVSFGVRPWVVDPASGNLDEAKGRPFVAERHEWALPE